MLKLKQLVLVSFILFGSVQLCAFCLKKAEPLIHIAPQRLSIDEALKITFRNRPSQKAFDYNIRAGGEHERAALSGYFPQLEVQSRVGTVNRAILLPRKQVFIEGKQLLLSFDGPIDRFRIARQETDITYSRKLLDKDNIRFETESSMLGLWDIREKYTFISSLGNSSEIIFQRDKHQDKLGLLDTNVWLTALAQYAQSSAQVYQYTDELNTALANVERSLGISITHDLSLNQQTIEHFIADNILAAYEHDANYYYQLALNNRKELRELDDQILREQYVSNSYAKSYLPEVYLFGQVNYYAFKPLRRAQQAGASQQGGGGASNRWVDWRVGLEFDWKFDGLGNAFNAESSHATMLAYQATRIDTTQQIKKEVHTTYDTLQRSLKDLYAQEVKFKQADNELILRQKQYEIGEISDVEMTQAETDWKQARYELITLKRQTATIYRELLSKSGYPESLS